jgi:adenylate cyclase class 2
MSIKEIECRFLEIDKEDLVRRLLDLGAHDEGENMLSETIIYDVEGKWRDSNKFIRLRKVGDKIKLSYKEHRKHTIDGADEIEFEVNDFKKPELLFEKLGLVAYRHQQKYRHTLELNGVTFDIDTWPKIPVYVEIEGSSEEAIRKAAEAVGFNWDNAVFHDAAWVIENKYNIPVRSMKWFTFDRFE